MRFDLTDREWASIEPRLPKNQPGRPRVDDRRVLSGVFFFLRTGIPWRDLPKEYGPYTTVYNRYNRWSRRGIWQRIFERVSCRSRAKLHLIDSSMVKAHRAAAGAEGGEAKQAVGISRGGRTSKIHALCDARGRPLRIIVTGGQVHDSRVAGDLIDLSHSPLAVVGDRAYDSRAIRQSIRDEAAVPVIPPRSNNPIQHDYDRNLYGNRNVIERFFCRIKDMRRIATRFEKLARNFLAMVLLCAIRIWIN